MSPVQQRRGKDPRSVAVGVGGVVIGITLLLLVFFLLIPKLTEEGTVKVNLGPRTLDLGNAEVKAAAIAANGPLLFQDPGEGQLDVYVQHLGSDPMRGWTAFDAREPGASRDCSLRWDQGQQVFVDRCDGSTVPADGGNLPRYVVDVDALGAVTLRLGQTSNGTSVGTIPAPEGS